MIADGLTKALDGDAHDNFIKLLEMEDIGALLTTIKAEEASRDRVMG